MNIDALISAVNVKRWHTANFGEETVGHHSAITALLAGHIFGCLGSQYENNYALRVMILDTALWHDLGEYAVGDIPAPTKRLMHPDMLNYFDHAELNGVYAIGMVRPKVMLTHDDKRLANMIVKLADRLSALFTAAVESAKGSQFAFKVVGREAAWLETMAAASGVTAAFLLEKPVIDIALKIKNEILDWLNYPSPIPNVKNE